MGLLSSTLLIREKTIFCARSTVLSLDRTMSRWSRRAQLAWASSGECLHVHRAKYECIAIQDNALYNKPRAALEIIPQLTDNPLFETSQQEQCKQRFAAAAPRLSLEESHFKPVTRRVSLSLSAKDYEGIWRAVQEDASKSSNESKSPLEDFKEFRQKLALLKQDMTGPTIGRSGFTSTGSTRSLNISPSRPTSPLKRLSVMTSRKTATSSGLNPQLAQQQQQRVLPAVQKIAVTMRAEGLFKLPSPASISPVPLTDASHPTTPPLRASSTPPTKRRFSVPSYRLDQFRQKSLDMTANAEVLRRDLTSKSGEIPEDRGVYEEHEVRREENDRHSRNAAELSNAGNDNESSHRSKKSGEAQAGSEGRGEHSRRWGSASSTASERKNTAQSTSSSIRRLPVPCGGPKAPKTPPQQVEAKKASSSSGRDWKVRCIPLPRPVCYSANILE